MNFFLKEEEVPEGRVPGKVHARPEAAWEGGVHVPERDSLRTLACGPQKAPPLHRSPFSSALRGGLLRPKHQDTAPPHSCFLLPRDSSRIRSTLQRASSSSGARTPKKSRGPDGSRKPRRWGSDQTLPQRVSPFPLTSNNIHVT